MVKGVDAAPISSESGGEAGVGPVCAPIRVQLKGLSAQPCSPCAQPAAPSGRLAHPGRGRQFPPNPSENEGLRARELAVTDLPEPADRWRGDWGNGPSSPHKGEGAHPDRPGLTRASRQPVPHALAPRGFSSARWLRPAGLAGRVRPAPPGVWNLHCQPSPEGGYRGHRGASAGA